MDRTTWLLAVHDLSLAAWFGGHWMGSLALNEATMEVDDHTQRIRVADAGWFRWSPVVAAAVGSHLVSARVLGRLGRHQPVRASLTAAAVLATIETGVSGRRVVRAGDVPAATAVVPIRATPPEVAAAQRRLRVAQWLVPLCTGLVWLVNAAQQDLGAA